MHLLAKEFPKLEIIRIPGYNIRYSKYLPMTFNILFQIPKLMWGIKQENQIIQNIIHDYNIDGKFQIIDIYLYQQKFLVSL